MPLKPKVSTLSVLQNDPDVSVCVQRKVHNLKPNLASTGKLEAKVTHP